jgi:hypothetical protein
MSTLAGIYGLNSGSFSNVYGLNTNYSSGYGNNTGLFGNNVMFPNYNSQFAPSNQTDNLNDLFLGLFSLVLVSLLGKNKSQNKPSTATADKKAVNADKKKIKADTNKNTSLLDTLINSILGTNANANKVAKTDNFVNTDDINNLFLITDENSSTKNINNLGKIGNIYILNKKLLSNIFNDKPIKVEKEEVEVKTKA